MRALKNSLRSMSGKGIARTAVFSILAFLAVGALYLVLLCHPGLFFRYSFRRGGIALYSDEPIPPRAAGQVLEVVEDRLARSPLGIGRG